MSGTVDFYEILEVNKQATADEIKISYKKLARVWHPDKNPDPEKKTQAEIKFKEISQAYDVLKNPDKRKAYDWELRYQAYKYTPAVPPPWNYRKKTSGWTSPTGKYYHERYPPCNWLRDTMAGGGCYCSGGGGVGGYDGWNLGSSDSSGLGGCSRCSSTRSDGGAGGGFGSPVGELGKAAHHGISRSSSPRSDSGDFGEPSKAACFGSSRSSSTTSNVGGGGDFGGEPRKAAPVVHVFFCTLEELYNGGTKEILITRKIRDASGKVQTREEKKIIAIKPGWEKGTKITFPEKGDQLDPGVIPADVVYVVDEIPHRVYKRDGDNLIAFHQITKAELNSGQFSLPSLDGNALTIRLPNNKLKAGNLDRPNEGMPISKEPGKRGNLRITYWVAGQRGGSPIKRVAKSLTRSLTMATCFGRRNGVVY